MRLHLAGNAPVKLFVKSTYEVTLMLTRWMYLALTLGSVSCASHTAPKHLAAEAPSPLIWPNIKFGDYQGPLGPKVVALTFDDGPDKDGKNTHKILDVLQQNHIKASFFVCGKLGTDLATDEGAQRALRRILAEGHDLGSHTYTHAHQDQLTDQGIRDEFEHNISSVSAVLGRPYTFGLYRIPYGFPFQTCHASAARVGPQTAPYGVHIGWGMDTDDWKCAQHNLHSDCLLHNLEAQIDKGHSGPILMHAIYPLTAETLPAIIDLLRRKGFRFVTAEQLVRDKYGMSSAELRGRWSQKGWTAVQLQHAAQSECRKNQPIEVPY
jgi:peptidoglycan/xylan/chitin deacetylase (PgdA/CDA1 family)